MDSEVSAMRAAIAGGDRIRRNTIGDAFARSARKFRGKVALRFADRVWTYAAMDEAVSGLAAHLLAQGLTPGDRVAAFGKNSDLYLLTFLACCRAGLIHVPSNFALQAHELAYVLEQSGSKLLIHDAALTETAVRAAAGLPRLTFAELLPATELRPDGPIGESVGDEDVAQILYTSGTTGNPKGAMLTHRGLVAQYASCITACEFNEDDRALAALPLYHAAQMHTFTMPQTLAGAETLLIESPVPALCLELIEAHRLTSFFSPPTAWINLLRHPDCATRDLSALKKVYYGAAIMPVPVQDELKQLLSGARLYNCYGQSEICPLATVLRPEDAAARPASIGRPVLNVETRVVDLEMRDAGPNVQGEIVHRSPQVMLGYWNKPEETRAAFEGGWFHSGDVGYLDEEGYLYIVDRIKDVINTGGVLVASREVEETLFTHPCVSECAVIAVPDPVWVEAIAAVIVLRDGHAAEECELIAHARERLAPYKVPKKVFFAPSLPKNTAGKLLKRQLRQEFSGTASAVMGLETAPAGTGTQNAG